MLEHKVNMGIQAHIFGPNFSWAKFLNYIFFPQFFGGTLKCFKPTFLFLLTKGMVSKFKFVRLFNSDGPPKSEASHFQIEKS